MPAKRGSGKEAESAAKGGAEEAPALVMPIVADELAASVGDLTGGGAVGADLSFDSNDIDDQMVLSLGDLLPDANGDVVLFNEAGPMAVNITTDERITETGTADHYVTSTGVDVDGYHFCTFEAGLTIYYPPEIDLLVTSQTG